MRSHAYEAINDSQMIVVQSRQPFDFAQDKVLHYIFEAALANAIEPIISITYGIFAHFYTTFRLTR